MADVIMADVIMAHAPPLKRQRGDAVLVVFDHPIFSHFPLRCKTWYVEEHNLVEDIKVWVQWKVYREHQVCFMLIAGKDRQFINKVNKTDALAALLKGIHLPVLQMQPCHITELNLLRVFLEWLVDLVDWAKRTACLQLIV